MREVRYESPKGRHLSSSWLREDDANARRVLEQKGWRVVETRDASEEREGAPLQPLPEANRLPALETDEFGATEPRWVESMAEPDWMSERLDMLTDEQRAALMDAGYTSEDALRDATDEQLREVKGIGPGATRNIRKALAAPRTAPEEGDAG